MKSKDKSSKQRFGNVNCERNKSQFIFKYFFEKISYTISENPKKNLNLKKNPLQQPCLHVFSHQIWSH